ncbi:NucA/NucB deoxyribonuclease domain-containing protein [Streptomyces sp. NPDC058200]|uniref:NucA/NucB deoxyribonuclease domain-containing protein n=1 Tax=Streptomyces sp. NPDC058200 TaxID=3346378 RepID=UPI0036F148FA
MRVPRGGAVPRVLHCHGLTEQGSRAAHQGRVRQPEQHLSQQRHPQEVPGGVRRNVGERRSAPADREPPPVRHEHEHRAKDAACSSTGEYATTGLPSILRPTLGQDCDEYPFRSTLEGAASPNWDFSVRAVDTTQNQSAGGSLSGFYGTDRVLAWDPTLPFPDDSNDTFYVRVT